MAVVVAVVVAVLRIHSGTAAEQDLTATVVAGDAAVVTLGISLFALLGNRVRKARAVASRRAALLSADAVGTAGGQLPRLGQVKLEALGVREPRTAGGGIRPQLPYVPRQGLEDRLREALGQHRFVLVHGHAAGGKSRSAAETCLALFAGRPVVIPAIERDKKGALARLVKADLVPDGAVVWLDDLDKHLNDGGGDAALLRRVMARPGLHVVATMRATAYERLKPTRDFRPSARDAVDLAERVEYPGWDFDARADAARHLADYPDVVAALTRALHDLGVCFGVEMRKVPVR